MRRSLSLECALKMHRWDPPYKSPKSIIPPRSTIRLKRRETDWDSDLQIGDIFRVGYYSRQDGPNCVWLVNAAGEYFHTWDQASLLDTFEVVTLSDETDIHGVNRPLLEPIL